MTKENNIHQKETSRKVETLAAILAKNLRWIQGSFGQLADRFRPRQKEYSGKTAILIVSDEEIIRKLISIILKNRGYIVFTASDETKAMEVISQKDTPLVLLDYMTPGMDGLTVLKEIIKRFPNTYVIIITGKGSEAIAVEMMKAGASDYILKPFTNLDLAERIDNVLKIRELELSNRDLLKEQERLLEEAAAWNCELEKRIVATREIPDCRKESINELLQKVDSFKAKNKAQYENKTVLIVDDEKIMLDLTSIILKNRNYKAFTASDGTEALEVISQENPAIVLLDYFMPGMDGLTVLREIKERFIDTYVIMFTGKGSEEIAVEVMKAGASDYILKPFNNQDLAERIDNVLKIRALELSNRDLLKERKLLMEEIVSWNLELEKLVEEISRK